MKKPERSFNDIHRIYRNKFRRLKCFIGNLRCFFTTKPVSQKHKIDELLKEEKFNIIILDACRFDYFKDEYEDFLSGDLKKVWSAGRDTFEYIKNIWPSYYDITYISGATPINSVVDESFLKGKLRNLYDGYIPKRHVKEIIDVWNHGWDHSLGTVPPKEVTDAALKYSNRKRLVIHYFQPHAPYIGSHKLLGYIGKEYSGVRDLELARAGVQGNPPDTKIWNAAKEGIISREELRLAYRSNLRLVLGEVKRLIQELGGKIVVTSDHGELLGEDGFYAHSRINHPKLMEIPWLVVSKAS